jgi:hypothetical protein
MFLSLTNVKFSNKDFDWGEKDIAYRQVFHASVIDDKGKSRLLFMLKRTIVYIIDLKYSSSIFASQGLRSALLIFTLGIVRRIFEVTR